MPGFGVATGLQRRNGLERPAAGATPASRRRTKRGTEGGRRPGTPTSKEYRSPHLTDPRPRRRPPRRSGLSHLRPFLRSRRRRDLRPFLRRSPDATAKPAPMRHRAERGRRGGGNAATATRRKLPGQSHSDAPPYLTPSFKSLGGSALFSSTGAKRLPCAGSGGRPGAPRRRRPRQAGRAP
jgi:hypothetical protein